MSFRKPAAGLGAVILASLMSTVLAQTAPLAGGAAQANTALWPASHSPKAITDLATERAIDALRRA